MDIHELTQYFLQYGAFFIYLIVLLEYMNLPGFPAGVIMPLSGIWAVHATGVDDVVRNGVNGFLTAEDEAVWAEKAVEALRPENLGRMREAARSDADNYRASRLAIYAEMLYNQCVLRKGENRYERSEDRGGHVAAAVRKVS